MFSIKKLAIGLTLFILCFSSFIQLSFAQETANASMASREFKTEEIRAQIEQPTDGFTIDPANPNTVNPRKFMFELAPGTSTTDHVFIRNLSAKEKTFSLYGADPTLSAQGTLAYKAKSEPGTTGEGTWIEFETPQVTLGPNESKILKFTVTAPKNASYGDHRAGIAMEKSSKDTQNPNITIATRIILHCEIKITDTPSVIEKLNPEESIIPQEQAQPWQFWYFWISLILFIVSFTALIIATAWEKKNGKQIVFAGTKPTTKPPTKAHPKKAPAKKRHSTKPKSKPKSRK